jgi:hypothetical protein
LVAGYRGSGEIFIVGGTINVTNGFFGQVSSTLTAETFVIEKLTQDNWLQTNQLQINGVVGLGNSSGVWSQPNT